MITVRPPSITRPEEQKIRSATQFSQVRFISELLPTASKQLSLCTAVAIYSTGAWTCEPTTWYYLFIITKCQKDDQWLIYRAHIETDSVIHNSGSNEKKMNWGITSNERRHIIPFLFFPFHQCLISVRVHVNGLVKPKVHTNGSFTENTVPENLLNFCPAANFAHKKWSSTAALLLKGTLARLRCVWADQSEQSGYWGGGDLKDGS